MIIRRKNKFLPLKSRNKMIKKIKILEIQRSKISSFQLKSSRIVLLDLNYLNQDFSL